MAVYSDAMPAYNTIPAIALQPGDTVNLIVPADSGVTNTQQVHIGPSGTASGTRVNVTNTTTQTATIQTTNISDVTGNYEPLKNADTAQAITLATATSASFDPGVCFLRANFSVAPTSGNLTISR